MLTIAAIAVVATSMSHYPANREPLQPSRFIKLPAGAIAPKGWLEKQLRLEADGFSGRLTEISPWLKKEGNAWLDPQGAGRSGWEEAPYWLKGFGDLGYVLRDKRIIDEARVWIEGAFRNQRADGWFGPDSNLTSLDGKPDLWPNMIMLNVLQSYYEFSGDKRVLDLMSKYFAWELTVPDQDFLIPYWQHHRVGDNLASVYWLYNRTAEPKLLDLAKKIHRCGADWVSGIPNLHGVNFAQAFREPATFWLQSKDGNHLKATYNRFDEIRSRFGQVPGGLWGADENSRTGYADPRQAAETCTMVETMLSCEMLARDTGDALWADRCEDVAFNSFPASMTPDLKALRYLTAPNMVRSDAANKSPGIQNGGPMFLFDPHDHRCCQHNSAHGWPYFTQSLWAATPNGGLAALLYAPCQVTAKAGTGQTVRLNVETKYPFEETIEIGVKPQFADRFPIMLRIPAWCNDPELSVNGQPLTVNVSEGFVTVNRTWSAGDTIKLVLPMPIRIDRWSGNKDSASVSRGPLTYSLKFDQKTVRKAGTGAWPSFEVLPVGPWNYGLDLENADIQVVKRPWPKNNQPFDWDSSPVELRAGARKIEGWKEDRLGLVGLLQQSPIKTDAPLERVAMVPMGCTRIRISQFPVVGQGPDAKPWMVPNVELEPSASHCHDADTLDALTDGILGRSSADGSIPRMTFWDHKGTQEWVQIQFKKARALGSLGVYWFDDTSVGGGCALPESWTVSVLVDGNWRVMGEGPTPKADGMNTVHFGAVECSAVRVNLKLKPGLSAGILEMRPGS